eukprot:scaffold217249_cov15-Prasinocladus_malaysianus.AAC.1
MIKSVRLDASESPRDMVDKADQHVLDAIKTLKLQWLEHFLKMTCQHGQEMVCLWSKPRNGTAKRQQSQEIDCKLLFLKAIVDGHHGNHA